MNSMKYTWYITLLCIFLFSCKASSTDAIEEVDGFPEAFQHVWQDSYYAQEGIPEGIYFTETSFFGWYYDYDAPDDCYQHTLGGVYVSHNDDEYVLDMLLGTRDTLIINTAGNKLNFGVTYGGETQTYEFQKTLFSVDDLTRCD